MPAAVPMQEQLLLGAPALLPRWIICSRDCGSCFSYQPVLRSRQDLDLSAAGSMAQC